MPQLSSTDILIMAAKDMTDALQNTHPEVPFARVGDDTISALAELAAIVKLNLQRFQLRLPRSLNAHALPNHPIQSWLLQCPYRDKRDHIQQFTHKTSPARHYLRGWSHLGHSTHHLRGCPRARRDSLLATCPKTTSAEWTLPPWSSP
jgi:hypothetical protein